MSGLGQIGHLQRALISAHEPAFDGVAQLANMPGQ
jgi:hypothetical protein